MESSEHLRVFTDERRAWREQILNGMLWATVATCVLVITWSLIDKAFVPSSRKNFVLVLVLACGLLLFRRLPFLVRASGFLLSFYAAIIFALVSTGLAPNPFIAMAILVVVSTLLLGRTPAIGITLLLIATFLVIHWLHLRGVLVLDPNWMIQLDIRRTNVAFRVATIFLFTAITLILAISYLLRRNESTTREKIEIITRLQEEHMAKLRVEADLEDREAAYRRASELEVLGRLAGSVAHDFNNALLVIFSALDEIGERSPVWSTHGDALSAIRSAARQAAATTRQLRSLGPGHPAVEAPLPLAPALRRAAVLLQRILPSNIRLVVVIDDEIAIAADENKIQRILTNLALNARDAMKDGGRLTLRLFAPLDEDGGPFARIEVTDTGVGMTEEVRARIFDPFFTTKAGSGTGLGLSSVRDLVTAHGGHLHVRSSPEQGSAIAVCWPSLTTWSAPAEDLPPILPQPTKLTVLFVDDDPIVRRALIRGLASHPVTLLEASNGTEAVEIARRHQDPIHVLCSDCQMPGLPVKQLIEEYRSLYPHGRVMVCSGYEPEDTSLSLGLVDDFFPKPFSASELANRIRQVATKPR